ncbi:MAG: hypothetical protein HQM02_08810 [Magnetococcales bacterium]|nr:hypothetical protein [Magnetococcales bacterium]
MAAPSEEQDPELDHPRTGTGRAAGRLAHGVRGVAGGVADVVKGGGNLVVGTVGIVIMPVVDTVGELFRAFKPSRKPPASEK